MRDRAWKAVHHEAVGSAFELVLDHGDDELVGNELAALHVTLGLLSERRARGAMPAKDVAGRDLLEAEALLEDAGLGALSRARRS